MPYGNRVALKLQTGDENDSEGLYIFTQEKKQLQALFPAEYHKNKAYFPSIKVSQHRTFTRITFIKFSEATLGIFPVVYERVNI